MTFLETAGGPFVWIPRSSVARWNGLGAPSFFGGEGKSDYDTLCSEGYDVPEIISGRAANDCIYLFSQSQSIDQISSAPFCAAFSFFPEDQNISLGELKKVLIHDRDHLLSISSQQSELSIPKEFQNSLIFDATYSYPELTSRIVMEISLPSFPSKATFMHFEGVPKIGDFEILLVSQ